MEFNNSAIPQISIFIDLFFAKNALKRIKKTYFLR
jgi:hypothetical protein